MEQIVDIHEVARLGRFQKTLQAVSKPMELRPFSVSEK
ncbi:hypothetical protein Mal48_35460 [Thalassoglobus polymorphus]|uniref:Uncharacterized protein n=1 Tax=Thalassoglobus polymorphus TaxID=2527994 RepID=A0A517QRN3_9PLAN|nr:hypothetical protein Mal48_35460 [Thalassoglobus polymorphus]